MNKSELITLLSEKHDLLNKDDMESSIKLIIECLSSSLSKGNRIEIRGFGSFSVRSRKERIGRNPKTGKSISVSSKFHPYFRASKSLRDAINN
mgnify:CR=1 FL=1|tara:strand:- start:1035 stop:1313 length:279 start_codon:yes stop_codon:yes gene_type:complete